MAELKEIANFQHEFDKKFFGKFWNIKNDKEFLDRLQYITIALTGEIGEFANIIKKLRRDYDTIKRKPEGKLLVKLREELTDCFIYIIIASNFLNIDLEKEYFKKMNTNAKRFKKYR